MYLDHVSNFIVLCGTLVVITAFFVVSVAIEAMDEVYVFLIGFVTFISCYLVNLFFLVIRTIMVSFGRLLRIVIFVVFFVFVWWSRIVVLSIWAL